MPSRPRSHTNGHPRSPRKLPWFLDALLWIRALVSQEDRAILDLIRLDLAEELDELLTQGVSRRSACREVWARVRLECRFFAPRALRWQRARLGEVMRAPRRSRTVLRTAAVVGVCGVALLSAKWFVFDRTFAREAHDVTRRLHETLDEVASTGDSLRQLSRTTETSGPLTNEMDTLLRRCAELKEYLVRTEREHPGEFGLHGWIGLIEESVALFWDRRGDEENARAHWRAAVSSYLSGVAASDRVAMLHLGLWYLDHGQVVRATSLLREAYHRWPGISVPGITLSGHVAAEFHGSLVELWRSERNPWAVVEARAIEEAARNRVSRQSARPDDYLILCNAAYLRLEMITNGTLEPVIGLEIPDLLLQALDVAGDSTREIASWIATDPDFAPIRTTALFAKVLDRASAILRTEGDGR